MNPTRSIKSFSLLQSLFRSFLTVLVAGSVLFQYQALADPPEGYPDEALLETPFTVLSWNESGTNGAAYEATLTDNGTSYQAYLTQVGSPAFWQLDVYGNGAHYQYLASEGYEGFPIELSLTSSSPSPFGSGIYLSFRAPFSNSYTLESLGIDIHLDEQTGEFYGFYDHDPVDQTDKDTYVLTYSKVAPGRWDLEVTGYDSQFNYVTFRYFSYPGHEGAYIGLESDPTAPPAAPFSASDLLTNQ